MKIRSKLPLGLGLAVLTGCTSVATRVPAIQIADRTILAGVEYDLLTDARGEVCRHYYGLWPIPVFWKTGQGEDGATADALLHAKGADLLLKTTVEEKTHSVGIWYSETCTTVKGKAVRIKMK